VQTAERSLPVRALWAQERRDIKIDQELVSQSLESYKYIMFPLC